QTWSANQIGINTSLLDLFESTVAKPLPWSDDDRQVIETVLGTVLHEMVHWSYYANGPVDEGKKWGGDEEHGTKAFEVEAFGHPIRLPLDRMCVAKSFPYLGIQYDEMTEYYAGGQRQVVQIKKLDPAGPGAKAGLKVGDVIRRFDDEEIWPQPQGFGGQLQSK